MEEKQLLKTWAKYGRLPSEDLRLIDKWLADPAGVKIGRGVLFVQAAKRRLFGEVVYEIVLGGAGAHAYPIERAPGDPFQSKDINYHYLLVDVDRHHLKFTMNRLDLTSGKAVWTQPDSLEITLPAPASARTG